MIVANDGRKTFVLTLDEVLERFEKGKLEDGESFAIPRFILENMTEHGKSKHRKSELESWRKSTAKKRQSKSVKKNSRKSHV